MSYVPDQEALDRARNQVMEAEFHLYRMVVDACLTPDKHQPVQHRDGKPPWCALCGRTNRGARIKEVDAQ